jgi:hypothetical protein
LVADTKTDKQFGGIVMVPEGVDGAAMAMKVGMTAKAPGTTTLL